MVVAGTKIRLRNQPDALARLCARHGDKILRLLATVKHGERDPLKVRLIKYYITMGGDWTRAREKQDWAAYNLSSLKYDTYRFVIQLLASAGDAYNHDLYQELATIQCALAHEGQSYAVELCIQAIDVAMQREEWGLALHVLAQWRIALVQLGANPISNKELAAVEFLHRKVLAYQAEVDQYAAWRLEVIEPIKQEVGRTDAVSQEKIDALTGIISQIRDQVPYSSTAKVEHFTVLITNEVLQKNHQGAVWHLQKLLETYEEKPFLITRHSITYLNHYRMGAILMGLTGNRVEAFSMLAQLETLSRKDWTYSGYAKHSWLRAAIQISYDLCDDALFQKAYNIMLSEQEEEVPLVDEGQWLRLYWLAIRYLLRGLRWRDAYLLCQRLIEHKTLIRRKMLVSARIASFACEIILFTTDSDRIGYSHKAHYGFLRRNLDNFPESVKVLRAFQKLWLAAIDPLTNKTKLRKAQFPTLQNLGLGFRVEDFAVLFENAKEHLTNLQGLQ